MKILPLFVLLACVSWQAYAQDDEPRPAARGLLKRGPNPRAKATTTTTPPPQEDVEYEDEGEYPEEGQPEPSSEAPPSSTEGKKLVGNGVRPFRSNTDLLETLKKRRMQQAEAKNRASSNSEPSAAPEGPIEPAKANYNNKKRAGFTNSPAKEITNEEAIAPSKPSRGRFGRPATRSIQSEAEESDAPAPTARSGRAFPRRGSN